MRQYKKLVMPSKHTKNVRLGDHTVSKFSQKSGDILKSYDSEIYHASFRQ